MSLLCKYMNMSLVDTPKEINLDSPIFVKLSRIYSAVENLLTCIVNMLHVE